MKKNYPDVRDGNPCIKKFLLTMKLSLLLTLLSLSVMAGESYSQVTLLDINVKNTKISRVFDKIEKQTDFFFFYNKNDFNDKQKVNLDCSQKRIDEILDKMLINSGMTYEIADQYIYILKPIEAEAVREQRVNILVKGIVKSCDDNMPLPGATVLIKGTTNGTVTDLDGKFTLDAPEGATLIISFIGMITKEVPVQSNTEMVIEICPDHVGLDEVVVVGYGTMKKSDLTGAVASVKAEELGKVATTNPAEALQGKVAGVSITKIGGAPGGGVDIKIRGVGTFGNNKPLVVIDGIKGDLSYVNQDDIESVEVLKDGAAAAIYGSEAANGVLLITTKKGKKGEIKVDFNGYTSITNPINTFDLLDAEGYKKVHTAMYQNAGEDLPQYLGSDYVNKHNTSWIDEVMRQGLAQNYSVSISGGNEIASYALSGQFSDEKGTLIGSRFNKSLIKARTNITKGRLSVDGSISYIESKKDYYKFSLRETYLISPMIPVKDDSQEYGYGLADIDAGMAHHDNPMAEDFYNDNENTVQYIISNFNAQLDIIDGLKFQSRGGVENSNEHSYSYYPPYMSNPKEPHEYPSLSENRYNWRQFQIENLLHFTKELDAHNISAVAGITAFKQNGANTYAKVEGKTMVRTVEDGEIVETPEAAGFLDYEFKTLNAGEGGTYSASGTNSIYTRSSMLGRINYNYAGRYYLQATIRRDGSSKFGENKRYGTFPSVALGWRVSEENFLDMAVLDNLKVRASYGVLGNEITLANYAWQPLIASENYYALGYVRGDGRNPWPGSIALDMENKDFRWEQTVSTNIGIDFALLQKLDGSINFYKSETKDLLIKRLIPASGGARIPVTNVGGVVNHGIELQLSYREYKGEFKYGVTTTFSTLNNEVTKLSSMDQSLFGTGLKYETEHFPTQSKVGYPIGAFFLYETDGIFQSDEAAAAYVNKDGERILPNAMAGDIKFKDTNGDGILDDKDKVYMGSGIPTYEYGVNLDASYKGFDITLFVQGVGGNKIYNGNRFEMEGMASGTNFLATTQDFWSESNKNSDMPRAVLGDPNGNARESDRFLEDGAYLRLKTLQLGYTLPNKISALAGIEKFRIYATGQNLLTFTNYSGVDPEVGSSNVLNTGVDMAIYPIARAFIMGVQVSF
jgi:TonB-linked SusC/RagA family outer membrane protein